jgi:hypothetical protein
MFWRTPLCCHKEKRQIFKQTKFTKPFEIALILYCRYWTIDCIQIQKLRRSELRPLGGAQAQMGSDKSGNGEWNHFSIFHVWRQDGDSIVLSSFLSKLNVKKQKGG